MKSRRILALALALAATAAAAFALQSALRPPRPPASMAALLPPGALLTIESPDFAALLHAWSASPESSAWLASANFSVFSNSRLFSRLAAAQSEFASTATLAAAGTTLLQQVAGSESIFAWYDVGNLEFLYITRLPHDRAATSELFQARGKFQRRQVGSSAFYTRTEVAPETGKKRTVAFASVGDLLLLSTREDLLANALTLLEHPSSESLAAEPWYLEADHASPPSNADLHMVLNLDRLVPLPYFTSYWVQGNVSEMSQYRTAVADLFREPTRFREERTLLLKSPPPPTPDPDLAPLAALAPPSAGVFRALSTSSPADAVATLNEKLLGHPAPTSTRETAAPNPSLAASPEGSASDLDTRIDTPAPVPESASTAPLLAQFRTLNAVLTIDSASPTPGLWIPIHSAVVLRTEVPLTPLPLQTALQQALRGSLTTSTLGIDWRPLPPSSNPVPILTLTGPKPLFLALAGNLTLLSDDASFLAEILARIPASTSAPPTPATYIAAFNHTSQRPPFAHLTRLIDGPTTPTSPPPFFSSNIRSLSDSFARLQSEHVLTQHHADLVHQTVLYQWQ